MAINPGSTLIDSIVPARSSRTSNLLKDGLLIVGFSLFLALCAQISIPLPFTPVPLTLQTLGVLLIGASLGSKRGTLAILAYLAEGALGLPVFAGATGGFLHLIGVTGGYLWSYPIAAFVVGLLCERGLDRSFKTSAIAMLVGTVLIYAIALIWLAVFLHVNLYQAAVLGMFPFIPGDLIKLAIAAGLLPTAWRIIGAVKPTGISRH